MKFHRASRILAVIAFAAVAGSVVASDDVLASKTGMTIYTFDKDTGGKSACNASCLALWPAVSQAEAPAANSNWGSIARDDGAKQLTYKGRPVYYYAQDKKPGDANGDGVGGVWHAIHKNAPTVSDNGSGYHSSGYSY